MCTCKGLQHGRLKVWPVAEALWQFLSRAPWNGKTSVIKHLWNGAESKRSVHNPGKHRPNIDQRIYFSQNLETVNSALNKTRIACCSGQKVPLSSKGQVTKKCFKRKRTTIKSSSNKEDFMDAGRVQRSSNTFNAGIAFAWIEHVWANLRRGYTMASRMPKSPVNWQPQQSSQQSPAFPRIWLPTSMSRTLYKNMQCGRYPYTKQQCKYELFTYTFLAHK